MCFGALRTFAGLEVEAASWIRRCFTQGQHRRRGEAGEVLQGGCRGAEGSARGKAGGVTKAVAEGRGVRASPHPGLGPAPHPSAWPAVAPSPRGSCKL